jgi:hypothetical protein
LSFFDDDEETAPRPAPRAPRRAGAGGGSAGGGPRRPHPRRPQHGGALAADQQTLMMRRGVAAGVAIVLVILIVLLVSGCLHSEKQQALKSYNHEVSALARESDEQVAHPLFAALTGATGKQALNVEEEVNSLRQQAEKIAARAKALAVPGEMADAQRNLLLALDLRVEAMDKLTEQLSSALGGQGKQQSAKLAGDMEIFLASDVVYSQRVAPLIQQALAANGLQGLATAQTRFLTNTGWLDSATVLARLGGQTSSSSTGESSVAPGHHGSVLKGVSVGGTSLEPEPALNHISGGSSPTFTLAVEDDGEFTETNVKVEVVVTAGGKQYKASHTIAKTEPGKSASAEVSVSNLPLGAASKIEAAVEPVPGETNHEGTKSTFLAIFE